MIKQKEKNNILHGYDQKLLKQYENILPWKIKNIEYQVNIFEKKCASIFLTVSVTDIFPLIINSLHLF